MLQGWDRIHIVGVEEAEIDVHTGSWNPIHLLFLPAFVAFPVLRCRKQIEGHPFCFLERNFQSPPDRGQSWKIRFSKFPGSGLKKI